MYYNYKFIGNIDTSNFFSNFTEEDWKLWILKQQKFYVHRNTNTIPIILDETYDELVLESNTETPNKFNNTVAWTIKGDSGNIYTRKTITYYETNKVIEICSCPSYYFCKSKPQTCKHITSGLF